MVQPRQLYYCNFILFFYYTFYLFTNPTAPWLLPIPLVVHLNTLAFAYRATLASLGIAFAYHEYVPSALNPSDPLSRIEGGLSASRLASLTSADLLRWCAVAGYCPTILAAVFPPLPEVLL